MIILLTNDDGIESDKLIYTKEILSKFGKIYTVAPKSEQSAKSMSLTIGKFSVIKKDEYTFAVEGTPVDCINFGIVGLNLKPDLVVSGTNNGYNIGIDTRYSGTVGAALQAQYFGFKSLAISSERNGYEILKKEFLKTIEYIFNSNLLSTKYTLNINFPRDKFLDSKGIKVTKVDYKIYKHKPTYISGIFKPNRLYIDSLSIVSEGTDTWAYLNGYTSISKISL
jgi:5'-nucleotidase